MLLPKRVPLLFFAPATNSGPGPTHRNCCLLPFFWPPKKFEVKSRWWQLKCFLKFSPGVSWSNLTVRIFFIWVLRETTTYKWLDLNQAFGSGAEAWAPCDQPTGCFVRVAAAFGQRKETSCFSVSCRDVDLLDGEQYDGVWWHLLKLKHANWNRSSKRKLVFCEISGPQKHTQFLDSSRWLEEIFPEWPKKVVFWIESRWYTQNQHQIPFQRVSEKRAIL